MDKMKIVLSGVETNNKGAELMLYAILQEIERKWPKAEVFISKRRIFHGLDAVKTSLNFRYFPCESMEESFHLDILFRYLHIPYKLMPHMLLLGKVDYCLDGSGFRFSDQFKITTKQIRQLEMQLATYKKKGARIVYLPQAWGPFEHPQTKEILSVLNQYATLLMPREQVSYKYIKDSGIVNMSKVKLFTDFTSLVEGEFPSQYAYLRNGICVIPNVQMIRKGAITLEKYIEFLKSIICRGRKLGYSVYLLNHEGIKDEQLCMQLKEKLPEDIEMVLGLNALEVKGLISSAYLVISSRFHGVVSALNSCVPCLATSWSHKYKELFNDYKMDDCILPLEDMDMALNMVGEVLQKEKNEQIRYNLSLQTTNIKRITREMWKEVWNSI